jgi:hypothetical protein
VLTSTCNGDNQMCHGRGPGWPDDFKSTRIHATKMAAAAEVRSRIISSDTWLPC